MDEELALRSKWAFERHLSVQSHVKSCFTYFGIFHSGLFLFSKVFRGRERDIIGIEYRLNLQIVFAFEDIFRNNSASELHNYSG